MKVDSHGCYGFLFPGTTEDDSGNNFKRYLYNTLCQQTPLHEQENGVHLKIVSGAKVYSHDCVHRLVKEELRKAVILLEEMFGQLSPAPGTTAAWSVAAAARGLRAGTLYVVEGGHAGRGGELLMRCLHHPDGLFRY